MSALILRLAGPLQSWGERSAFAPVRDTAPFPTRSALTGMFAAAEGISRDDSGALHRYRPLRFTIRIDRPGVPLIDYHTAGGGRPTSRTAATSGGSNKGAAVITRRHYLADAVFVVAVSGPDPTIDRLARALRRPCWAPYLGRRSCCTPTPPTPRPNCSPASRSAAPTSRPTPTPPPSPSPSSTNTRPPTDSPAPRPTLSASTTSRSASPPRPAPTARAPCTAPPNSSPPPSPAPSTPCSPD
ncbi:type I-E CRISPR-associated protein Cas5/CasD [Streptomyces albofaciens]|uniref:type I-E CRISPR-associated protein Cas5/CasD n=1 Tax=Streptomyces albofaciens TaxID=66866 RepID=UPI001FCCB9FC|nr:type I-E CRISPR-associated protein Cas5/CasD [Streptomyces albofaciens]